MSILAAVVAPCLVAVDMVIFMIVITCFGSCGRTPAALGCVSTGRDQCTRFTHSCREVFQLIGLGSQQTFAQYSNVNCSSSIFSMAAAWIGNADRVDENTIIPKNVEGKLILEACAFNCAAASCSVVQCSVNDVPLTNLVLNSECAQLMCCGRLVVEVL